MIETQILQHEVSLTEYVPACVEVEKFVKFCEECPSYEKNWACPPFNFSPQEIWQKHDSLLLYGKKIFLGAELTGKQYESDELISLGKELLLPIKQDITAELLAMEERFPGSMALFAGKCEGCENCVRQEGQACIRPEYMRHSLESLGGDVGKTLELYFGESLIWAAAGRLPEKFLLIGGLLK